MLADAGEHRHRRVGLDHQGALGHLELDGLRRQAVAPGAVRRLCRKQRVAELAAGDVDGDREVGVVLSLPRRRLAARLVEHVLTQLGDQAGLLRDPDELGRGQQTALRVLPAHQRLGAEGRPLSRSTIGW